MYIITEIYVLHIYRMLLYMPIFSRWYDEQQSLILTQYDNGWTWQQRLNHDVHIITPMINAGMRPIALMEDLRRSHWIPTPDFQQLVKETITAGTAFPIDVVVFISKEPSINALLVAAHQHHGADSRIYLSASTVEQACQLIQENR